MNRDKRSLPKWIILPAVFVIGMIILVSFSGHISQLISQHTPMPYYEADEPLVEAAIREAYGAGTNISEVKRHSYAVVVYLPDMKCVGLNTRPGWLGVTQTVCFKTSDGSVAIRHSS